MEQVLAPVLPRLLGGLDPLPLPLHLVRGRGPAVGEDVRVTTHQLVDEQPGDGVDVEALVPGLLRHPGMEDDLEQDVAELLGQVPAVAGRDGVHGLVRLLDEVRRQALVRLLGVPGAPAGRAQPVHRGHDVQQPPALDVPGPDDHLDLGGLLEPGHLGRDGVGEPRVAVRGPAPQHVGTGGQVDEGAGERGRGLVRDVDGHARLDEGLDERLVRRTAPDVPGPLHGLPRLARQQSRRDPGRGEQQPEAAPGHCAGWYGSIHAGVVRDTAAVSGSNSP